MAYNHHPVGANYVPGAFDEYYEPPSTPQLVSPLPQRIMPEMSDQISEGIHNMSLNNRQSVASIASMKITPASPFPKLTNPPPNIPPSDQDFENTLEVARTAVLSSNDPDMQLSWSEDALQQIEINAEDRTRLQNMQMRRPSTPPQEEQIKMDAMNIVGFLADQHHPRAEFIRGMWFEFGKFGCQMDKKEAFRCYSRAADKQYARAEYRIGMLYEAANDPVKALRHYHKGNAVSDAACLYRLGMMTLRGQHGQQQDFPRGVEFVRQSAALADDNAPQGAYVYGMMLARELTQISVPENILPWDERQARIEIEKAAYMKFAKAQLRMGQAYELASLGCEFNPAYSLHYYSLAARQGEPEAEMGISKWFLVGHEGVFPKNEELAYIYAQRAALSGLANAEFALGYFNELGIHIPKNIDLALEWYKKAAANGNTDAQGRIDGIAQKQVLSKSDHEKFAINRIKSQYGSRRGGRPERFSSGNRLPSIGDGQQSARVSGQFPPRGSSAAPYPMDNGPPTIPPLNFRPQSAAPYPDSPTSAFHVVPAERPYSSVNAPDARLRHPSGPGLRPNTSINEYGQRPNQRIVSSPAGMYNSGPALPPKQASDRHSSSSYAPTDAAHRRPTTQQSLNKPVPSAPGGVSPMSSNSGASFPSRGSSKPRPDLGVQSLHPDGRKPSPGPDYRLPSSGAAPPPKPGARPPGKGPKTFEEMGVPAGKTKGDCEDVKVTVVRVAGVYATSSCKADASSAASSISALQTFPANGSIDSCKYEHPSSRGQSSNRFATLSNTNAGRGRSNDPQAEQLPYSLAKDTIIADLRTERPQWPLSAYGPGREAPRQLFGGHPIEQSPEEMRVMFYLAQSNGNTQPAIQAEQELTQQLNQQIQTILNDPDGAIRYIIDGDKEHPNRRDLTKVPSGQTSGQAVNPFSAANATPSGAFGQPAPAFGQPSGAFGASTAAPQPGSATAFGQPTQLGGASAFGRPAQLGQGSAFGQPSQMGAKSAFGQPSAFGQASQLGANSALVTPSQSAGGTSPFGQPPGLGNRNAFGQPSGLGQNNSPFGQASRNSSPFTAQNTPTPFGQQNPQANTASPFASANTFQQANTGSPFRTPSFGQPTSQSPFATAASTGQQNSSPFAQAGQPSNAPNPFGQPSQAQPSPFAQASQQQSQPQANTSAPFSSPAHSHPAGQPQSSLPGNSNATPSATPPLQSYARTGPDGKILSWKNRPATYIDSSPYYSKTGNVSHRASLERIWLPGGEPPANPYTDESETLYERAGDALRAAFERCAETGRFEGGMVPVLAPRRAWVRFDI